MLVKKVNKNTIDVFMGIGWEEWARFKISYKDKQNPKCYQVAGVKMSPNDVATLESKINE